MTDSPPSSRPRVAVIGGGPAGLMAAEVLSSAVGSGGLALDVDVYDAMPSVGRKFLLAGRGGLNLTHSEPEPAFRRRYGDREGPLAPALDAFGPDALRAWAEALGVPTFVGTSGRVFPVDMKAAPLLRAWLHRLRAGGVKVHTRHRWTGWGATTPTNRSAGQAQDLCFDVEGREVRVQADAVLLALGGASWSRLGSDGAWVPWLRARGVDVAPLKPSNCGFDVRARGPGGEGWSEHLRSRFAGQPVKPVAARLPGGPSQQGEFVITETGVEGSLVYAFSAALRDRIAAQGEAVWLLDLLPQHTPAQVLAETTRPRGPRSLSTHLKSRLGLQGLKMALLHELLTPAQLDEPAALAEALKALPLKLVRPRPIDEAISTAGGVAFEALDDHAMLRPMPGVFCAGEMLDWEAPTGGYLLTASMSTGRWAAQGLLHWLSARRVG